MKSDISSGQLDGEPSGLKLIADETRWRILRVLRTSDRQVGEIVTQTGLPQNLVSYHLGILRQAGLVQQHRSDADGRTTYYGVNLGEVSARYRQIGADLAIPSRLPTTEITAVTVLFLCRANSARSQIAEGWLRTLTGGRIVVRSGGTQPAQLHPLATQVMTEAGVDIGHQQTKSISTLADLAPNVVVTVCDVAREECALWPEVKTRIHWSIPDPVVVTGAEEQLAAFRTVRDELRGRIEGLIELLINPSWLA
jgi:ArsR family transcriptional regulator, arsenate/arsenite/antimonite-responsive transcriptional repressor / arsenate reductase (thioredoxin)